MFDQFIILIHGYTLLSLQANCDFSKCGTRSWQNVVIGDIQNNKLGRLPKGLIFALQTKTEKLFLGTGASALLDGNAITRNKWQELSEPQKVKWESEYTFDFLMQNLNLLIKFPSVAETISQFGGIEKTKDFLKRVTMIDTKSKDTSEEIANAVTEGNRLGVDGIVSVSSPSHEPRCIAIANKIVCESQGSIKFVVSFPCETDFADNQELVIFEPPSGPVQETEINAARVFTNYFLLSPVAQRLFLSHSEQYLQNQLQLLGAQQKNPADGE